MNEMNNKQNRNNKEREKVMKKKIPKVPFTIKFGGTLGNYVYKLEHIMRGRLTTEEIKEYKKNVFTYCDLGSLYFTNELLKGNNNHHIDKLNVNLEKFVNDEEYYFHIFEHNRPVYNMIVDWFGGLISDYWKELNQYLFYDNVDNSTLELFWDVMTYGLNYYPYNEIGEEDKLRDILKCMEKDTDWDCEKGIEEISKREDGFKGDILDREGTNTETMEVV